MSDPLKKPISEATDAELRAFARKEHNLDIHHLAKRETILNKIALIWANDWIMVWPQDGEGADPVEPVETDLAVKDSVTPVPRGTDIRAEDLPPGPLRAEDLSPEDREKLYVTVNIARTEDPGGNDPVPLSVNGRAMYVPRDQDCEIRYPYYEVLKGAVTTKYDQKEDGEMVPRHVPLYPFSLVETIHVKRQTAA